MLLLAGSLPNPCNPNRYTFWQAHNILYFLHPSTYTSPWLNVIFIYLSVSPNLL